MADLLENHGGLLFAAGTCVASTFRHLLSIDSAGGCETNPAVYVAAAPSIGFQFTAQETIQRPWGIRTPTQPPRNRTGTAAASVAAALRVVEARRLVQRRPRSECRSRAAAVLIGYYLCIGGLEEVLRQTERQRSERVFHLLQLVR